MIVRVTVSVKAFTHGDISSAVTVNVIVPVSPVAGVYVGVSVP